MYETQPSTIRPAPPEKTSFIPLAVSKSASRPTTLLAVVAGSLNTVTPLSFEAARALHLFAIGQLGFGKRKRPYVGLRENHRSSRRIPNIFNAEIEQHHWGDKIESSLIDGDPSAISINYRMPVVGQLQNEQCGSTGGENNCGPSSKSGPLCPTYERGFVYLVLFIFGVIACAIAAYRIDNYAPRFSWVVFPIGGLACLLAFVVQMGCFH
jgi:hypothetical protein